MLFRILDFKGALPRLNPRLLPDNFAQIARNVRLEDGAIGPVRAARIVNTFGAPVQSFHKDGATWRGFASLVDVAPAPIAANRLYYTGDGAPKMIDGVTTYDLKLPAPVSAPAVANLATPTAALIETVHYAYTWVTGFGEESPPSPLSAALNTSEEVTVRVNGFAAAPAGRNITAKRIYRSKTSASGVTGLFFVAEIAAATASYDHGLASAPLAELIPSTDYDPPPDALAGLTGMPNGMMAAFSGKEVFFCEPYQPHAWPQTYTLTVDHDIVGLATFGSTLAILTTANPYIAQGTHPESMAMEKVDKSLPCLSRRGIVDIGYAAYYPSSEGLAMISGADAQIVTRGLFTREQWLGLSPDTFVAESFDGRYVFTFTYETFDGFDGGDSTAAPTDGLDGGTSAAFPAGTPSYDFGTSRSAFGAQRLGMIDLAGQQPYFIDHDLVLPDYMRSDPASGDLYLLDANGMDVRSWDDLSSPAVTAIWRSKRIVLPFSTNLGAILVQSDGGILSGDTMAARVFADGVYVGQTVKVNEPDRLPAGFQAKVWEIEVEGNMPVTGLAVAHSLEELVGL